MYRIALSFTFVIASAACTDLIDLEDLPPADPGHTPTVTLTSPAGGLPVSGTIVVSADAWELAGTVASVTFDLPDGERITDTTAPFATTWDSTTVADGSYAIGATATDNQGTATTTSARFPVSNTSCLEGTFSADIPRPIRIPDASSVGLTTSIPVIGDGTVASLSLSLSIAHPFPSDLLVTLISPDGSRLTIDEPDPGAPDLTLRDQTFTLFDGETAAGRWKLFILDRAPQDVGTLEGWSLTIQESCNTRADYTGAR
jgi:hypothetical protein